MTMKVLGMRMGFDEKAASCRIAQWEQGFRNLSPESSDSLAKILNVAPARLAQSPENPVDALIEYFLWLDEAHDANFYGEMARLSDFLSQYWNRRSLPFCISWSMKSSMTSRVTSRTLSTGTLRWK